MCQYCYDSGEMKCTCCRGFGITFEPDKHEAFPFGFPMIKNVKTCECCNGTKKEPCRHCTNTTEISKVS